MSLNIAGIGCGEGGGRMAMAMALKGFNIGAINTNDGDLRGLNAIPEYKKLLLKISDGGSGKDPKFVKDALKDSDLRREIVQFIKRILDTTPIFSTCPSCGAKEKLLDTEAVSESHVCSHCTSTFTIKQIQHEEDIKHNYLFLFACLGGGSGSGLIEDIIDICKVHFDIPVGLVCSIPDDSEDIITKKNAMAVLKNIYNNYAVDGKVRPFILVDNQKLMETLDLPLGNVYSIINSTVAQTIDEFNRLSDRVSKEKTIDNEDMKRLLSDDEGCCALGKFSIGNKQNKANKYEVTVESFVDFAKIDEAMDACLFVDGFDLSTAKYISVVAIGPSHFLDGDYPRKAISYIQTRAAEITNAPKVLFTQYEDETKDCLEFYMLFNGLKSPDARLERLWNDIKSGASALEAKRQRMDGINYQIELESSSVNHQKREAAAQTAPKDMPRTNSFVHKTAECNNCYIDKRTKKSLGVYKPSGPIDFTGKKVCPVCNGSGKMKV